MRQVILTGVSLALVLAPASAAVSQTTPAPVVVIAKPVVEKAPAQAAAPRYAQVVCKSSNVTGSRVRKEKICLTRRQWDRKSRTGQAVEEELGRDRENTINPVPR